MYYKLAFSMILSQTIANATPMLDHAFASKKKKQVGGMRSKAKYALGMRVCVGSQKRLYVRLYAIVLRGT